MTVRPRTILTSSCVAIIAIVNVTAVALGPTHARARLLVSGLLAVGAALQSIAWEPDDLMAALLFSLPPVIALVADGSPTWLIALGLGVSLVVYAAGGLPTPGSVVVVIIAASAVVALGRVLFRPAA